MSSLSGYMFDTNIFDKILDGNIDLPVAPAEIFIYVTHIQMDEIKKCPDEARRQALLKKIREIPSMTLPTESFVLDTSCLGQGKLSDGVLYDELQGGNPKHTEDALIAETCIKNNLILVTEDKELAKRACKRGAQVLNLQEFLRL